VATLGVTAVTGALPGVLAPVAAPLGGLSPMVAALALYLAGVLVLAVVGLGLVAWYAVRRGERRAA
jgi:hypothetical protein